MPFSYEAKYTKQNNEHTGIMCDWRLFRKRVRSSVIIVATDTTARKTAEAEIKSLNDSLEKKVKRGHEN